MSPLRLLIIFTLIFTQFACGAPTEESIEDGIVVPEGKDDDFLSLSAYEYIIEGRTQVTLESRYRNKSERSKKRRLKKLIGYKQVAIAWFLTEYLVEKEKKATNREYGGFGGMAKAGDYEELDIQAVNALTYEFTFRQIVAGGRNLMRQLPILFQEEGFRLFKFYIGKPTNREMSRLSTNNEWYRKAPWKSWNPENVDESKLEELLLGIKRSPKSSDAWFQYNELFADGKLTLDIHFGFDYHEAFHLKHARQIYSWLTQRKGFDSPVRSFNKLDRNSGPFVRTIEANGEDIDIEVRIFYPKDGSRTDPNTDAGGRQLERDMRKSLLKSDVVLFSGHSGPFYGFALANWKKTDEGDIDDSEIAKIPLRKGYQVVFAYGCDTYHLGEAFKRNPAKKGKNIDIITTTSYSDAGSPQEIKDFISRLTELDSHGRHRPRTVKSLLQNFEDSQEWTNAMYGIHGIDDNPKIHPYANLENLCMECSANAECGGVGNSCVRLGRRGRRCVVSCTDDSGCPTNYRCRSIASASSRVIYDKACIPNYLRCQ